VGLCGSGAVRPRSPTRGALSRAGLAVGAVVCVSARWLPGRPRGRPRPSRKAERGWRFVGVFPVLPPSSFFSRVLFRRGGKGVGCHWRPTSGGVRLLPRDLSSQSRFRICSGLRGVVRTQGEKGEVCVWLWRLWLWVTMHKRFSRFTVGGYWLAVNRVTVGGENYFILRLVRRNLIRLFGWISINCRSTDSHGPWG
jgi:hypothetical protein